MKFTYILESATLDLGETWESGCLCDLHGSRHSEEVHAKDTVANTLALLISPLELHIVPCYLVWTEGFCELHFHKLQRLKLDAIAPRTEAKAQSTCAGLAKDAGDPWTTGCRRHRIPLAS